MTCSGTLLPFTDTCDEADNGDETSGLPSTPSIAPLSMDSDEDAWLT
jgi:hypothetical protein